MLDFIGHVPVYSNDSRRGKRCELNFIHWKQNKNKPEFFPCPSPFLPWGILGLSFGCNCLILLKMDWIYNWFQLWFWFKPGAQNNKWMANKPNRTANDIFVSPHLFLAFSGFFSTFVWKLFKILQTNFRCQKITQKKEKFTEIFLYLFFLFALALPLSQEYSIRLFSILKEKCLKTKLQFKAKKGWLFLCDSRE